MTQDWRIEVDAVDYFGHQKKKVELEQRRPVIRQASDLVGPGIGAASTRVTNWNDVLATFNGYYSSLPGAFSAPDAEDSFVGTATSDSELGGTQTVTGLNSQITFTRVFVRSPADPETLGFGDWVPVSGAGNLVRLNDWPLFVSAGQWSLAQVQNPQTRGNRVQYTAPGIITVTRDGWYEVSAQCRFTDAVDGCAIQVVTGSNADDGTIFYLSGPGYVTPTGLGDSLPYYLEAGTTLRMFVFATASTSTDLKVLSCRET